MKQTRRSKSMLSKTLNTSNDEIGTVRISADEKSDEQKQNSPTSGPETKGCATSFIMAERGEIGGVCGEAQKDAKGKYVQPDKEKEAGGEG
jgi:hypothetical protein